MVSEKNIISVEDKPLEDLQSHILKKVRDCTLNWAGNTGPVQKSLIRPDIMPECLPHVSIVERRSGPKRFYIRLTGEEITNRTLGYVAGKFIEDVTPPFYRDAMIKYYGQAIDGEQQIAQNIVWNYDHRLLHIERFMVPLLLSGQDHPTALLIATVRGAETLEYMQTERHFDPEELIYRDSD